MKKVLTAILISSLLLAVTATSVSHLGSTFADSPEACSKGKIDCAYPGDCGSYTDQDQNGYCDYSQSVDADGNLIDNNQQIVINEKEQAINQVPQIDATENEIPDSDSGDISKLTDPADSNVTAQIKYDSRYNLILITAITIVLYVISYIFMRKRVMTLISHRKIWNYILLVSALVTLILGFLLTLELDLNIRLHIPFNMTFWHVETGIVMSVIAVCHIFWHWRYLFKIKKKADN